VENMEANAHSTFIIRDKLNEADRTTFRNEMRFSIIVINFRAKYKEKASELFYYFGFS
jgi:hypothetical protein